ncbi:hypothetical protein [Geobacillus thermodenitrificans]|uniref:Uncharacterized protein n=1 Tax=Geobacillus thermodenitrificans TaxID=33940 RepID=A0ABY9QED8_GEOTD|nr:hypothetical protein [Geobacillus thermodenitrificans]WMV77257.1 hypothetical protein HSX42_05675 [Geobacillus thermodenitrificans]
MRIWTRNRYRGSSCPIDPLWLAYEQAKTASLLPAFALKQLAQ